MTILLVEDIEDTLEATRLLLEELSADLLVARDGVDAMRVLARSHPDIVLCDLRMPRMDGFEFLLELSRLRGPDHPPVVAVSALATEAEHRRTRAVRQRSQKFAFLVPAAVKP
ncbi:MAG: response regulator [Gemmatimonadota bacterium]